ncbi:hypothetical protein [Chromobacterium sinusclupearum]|uniref:hypothetical protein n=1 Tax=Chromobacterium sinusclupearum TaxID=2077146 RepID=UPI0011AECAA1|nr:hypothetical protein [Chromobacterium sinusclupearum]
MSDVYEAEVRDCKESIEKITWKYESVESSIKYLRCPECKSALIQAPDQDDEYPDIHLICKSCNYEFQFTDVIEECIEEHLSVEEYISVKDGGDYLYEQCPHCSKKTFINMEGRCVACEQELDYTECEICGTGLTIDDQDNDGLCSSCHYIYKKTLDD